jgi:molybdate transport system regulatory protein
MVGTRLTLRVDFGADRAVGPGKVRLLEAIRDTGSISQAGRALGMSYRRAWLLVDDLNNCFRHAVIEAQPGGTQGGGATLTEFGKELIRDYRAIEAAASAAAEQRLSKLAARLRGPREGRSKPRKTSIRAASRR